jgi:hypothetical protein
MGKQKSAFRGGMGRTLLLFRGGVGSVRCHENSLFRGFRVTGFSETFSNSLTLFISQVFRLAIRRLTEPVEIQGTVDSTTLLDL